MLIIQANDKFRICDFFHNKYYLIMRHFIMLFFLELYAYYLDALDRSGWSADDNGTLDVVYEQGHNQQGPTLVK